MSRYWVVIVSSVVGCRNLLFGTVSEQSGNRFLSLVQSFNELMPLLVRASGVLWNATRLPRTLRTRSLVLSVSPPHSPVTRTEGQNKERKASHLWKNTIIVACNCRLHSYPFANSCKVSTVLWKIIYCMDGYLQNKYFISNVSIG